MALFQESGSTPEGRRSEADRLIEMIADQIETLTKTERDFVERISDNDLLISPKQLFWLRDIKDKYL